MPDIAAINTLPCPPFPPNTVYRLSPSCVTYTTETAHGRRVVHIWTGPGALPRVQFYAERPGSGRLGEKEPITLDIEEIRMYVEDAKKRLS